MNIARSSDWRDTGCIATGQPNRTMIEPPR
jgi:hypothetical protein